ncbi:hypothetical protein EON68_02370 [archaeon]|nr:MAG: hypothetical protein EON68_02370 [archaeon]
MVLPFKIPHAGLQAARKRFFYWRVVNTYRFAMQNDFYNRKYAPCTHAPRTPRVGGDAVECVVCSAQGALSGGAPTRVPACMQGGRRTAAGLSCTVVYPRLRRRGRTDDARPAHTRRSMHTPRSLHTTRKLGLARCVCVRVCTRVRVRAACRAGSCTSSPASSLV